LFLSIVVRYLFASGGAYVAAMVPVFATVGLVTGTAPALLALAILFSNSYGAVSRTMAVPPGRLSLPPVITILNPGG
jgi:di/tricarboxylate transporter